MGQEVGGDSGTNSSHHTVIAASSENSACKINQSLLEQQIGYYQLTQFEVKYGLLQVSIGIYVTIGQFSLSFIIACA